MSFVIPAYTITVTSPLRFPPCLRPTPWLELDDTGGTKVQERLDDTGAKRVQARLDARNVIENNVFSTAHHELFKI